MKKEEVLEKKRKCNGNCPGCPNRGNCTGNCKECPMDCPNKLKKLKKKCPSKCKSICPSGKTKCPITGIDGCPVMDSGCCIKGFLFGLFLFGFTILTFICGNCTFTQGLFTGLSIIYLLYVVHAHLKSHGQCPMSVNKGKCCPVTGKCGGVCAINGSSSKGKCPVSGKCGTWDKCSAMMEMKEKYCHEKKCCKKEMKCCKKEKKCCNKKCEKKDGLEMKEE